MGDKMMSVHELAELWGVSQSHIRRLIARRENGLRAYKLGGKICIKISDAQAYLDANEIKAPEKQEPFPGMVRFRYTPGMKVVSL